MTGRWKRYQTRIDRDRHLWLLQLLLLLLLLLLLAHSVKSELTGIQGTAQKMKTRETSRGPAYLYLLEEEYPSSLE